MLQQFRERNKYLAWGKSSLKKTARENQREKFQAESFW